MVRNRHDRFDGVMAAHTRLPALLLISVAAFALTGCRLDIDLADGTERVVLRDTVDVDTATVLAVATDNGAIRIERGGTRAVEVEAIVDASRRKDADFTVEHDGDRIEIDGRCDSSWWRSCRVGIVVTVPAALDVDARSGSGRIDIDGIDGRLTARSSNGAIAATDLRAPEANVRSGNGAIDLSFDAAPGLVDVETSNGSIEVRMPDDGLPYAVDAESNNGAITIDVDDDADAKRTITSRSGNGLIEIGYRAR